MTTFTITYKSCNGCAHNELHEIIDFARSEPRFPGMPSAGTIDLCETCVEAGLYICRYCHKVHDDENPCTFVAEMAEQAEAARANQHSLENLPSC